jgi:hypothetical protein
MSNYLLSPIEIITDKYLYFLNNPREFLLISTECWSKAIRRDHAKSEQNYRNKEANKQKELRVPSHSFLRPSHFLEESRKAAMASSLLYSASIICA